MSVPGAMGDDAHKSDDDTQRPLSQRYRFGSLQNCSARHFVSSATHAAATPAQRMGAAAVHPFPVRVTGHGSWHDPSLQSFLAAYDASNVLHAAPTVAFSDGPAHSVLLLTQVPPLHRSGLAAGQPVSMDAQLARLFMHSPLGQRSGAWAGHSACGHSLQVLTRSTTFVLVSTGHAARSSILRQDPSTGQRLKSGRQAPVSSSSACASHAPTTFAQPLRIAPSPLSGLLFRSPGQRMQYPLMLQSTKPHVPTELHESRAFLQLPSEQRNGVSLSHLGTAGQSWGAFRHVWSKHLYGFFAVHVTGRPHFSSRRWQVPSAHRILVSGHGEKSGHWARDSLQLLSGQRTANSGGQIGPVGQSFMLNAHVPSGQRMFPVVSGKSTLGHDADSSKLSGHGSTFCVALNWRHEPSQHFTSPYLHELDLGQRPMAGAHEPIGHRTSVGLHAVPVLIDTTGHLSTDSLQLPSEHLTGHLVEHRVSWGQSVTEATQAPVGHRIGNRIGQTSAGCLHCVTLPTQELSQHLVGTDGGQDTLVGQVRALVTHDPSPGHLVSGVPSASDGHAMSSRQLADDSLHDPSGHFVGCVDGQEETDGHKSELCWQLPSGQRMGFFESQAVGILQLAAEACFGEHDRVHEGKR